MAKKPSTSQSKLTNAKKDSNTYEVRKESIGSNVKNESKTKKVATKRKTSKKPNTKQSTTPTQKVESKPVENKAQEVKKTDNKPVEDNKQEKAAPKLVLKSELEKANEVSKNQNVDPKVEQKLTQSPKPKTPKRRTTKKTNTKQSTTPTQKVESKLVENKAQEVKKTDNKPVEDNKQEKAAPKLVLKSELEKANDVSKSQNVDPKVEQKQTHTPKPKTPKRRTSKKPNTKQSTTPTQKVESKPVENKAQEVKKTDNEPVEDIKQEKAAPKLVLKSELEKANDVSKSQNVDSKVEQKQTQSPKPKTPKRRTTKKSNNKQSTTPTQKVENKSVENKSQDVKKTENKLVEDIKREKAAPKLVLKSELEKANDVSKSQNVDPKVEQKQTQKPKPKTPKRRPSKKPNNKQSTTPTQKVESKLVENKAQDVKKTENKPVEDIKQEKAAPKLVLKSELEKANDVSKSQNVDPKVEQKQTQSPKPKTPKRRPTKKPNNQSTTPTQKVESKPVENKAQEVKKTDNKPLEDIKQEKAAPKLVLKSELEKKNDKENNPKKNSKKATSSSNKSNVSQTTKVKEKVKTPKIPELKINEDVLLSQVKRRESYFKNLFKDINEFISKELYLDKDIKLVIGVSGGCDSVVLLDILANLSNENKYTLYIAHLDHGMRKESSKDLEFVNEIAKKYNIKFFSKKVDVKEYASKKPFSVEESARILRYEFFEEVTEKVGAHFLVLAHNANDSTETFFINLFRGTGLSGLSGIPQRRPLNSAVNIIRPIINLTRDEIEEYAEKRNLTWVNDETNKQNIYLRNRIRNEFLPFIQEKFDRDIIKSVNKTSKLINAADVFIYHKVKNYINEVIIEKKTSYVEIDLKKLFLFDDFVKAEIIGLILKNNFDFINLTQNIVKGILNLYYSEPGASFIINEKLTVYKDRDTIFIARNQLFRDNSLIIDNIGEFRFENKIFKLSKVPKTKIELRESEKIEYFDMDYMPDKLEIRHIKDGDKFTPIGMTGRIKVNDFLTNNKIPLLKKKDILVLSDRVNIIWLCEHRIADKYKITKTTKKVLKIEIEDKK